MMLISITILSCLNCIGQTTYAGIDLSEAIRSDRAGLVMGHAVNRNWSVSASVSIRIDHSPDISLKEHDRQFNSSRKEAVKYDESRITPGISAQYWPSESFKGLMLSFGLTAAEKTKCSLAIGYLCQIWKGLRGGIAYRMVLNDTLRYGDHSSNGFRTGLCYTF